MVLDFAGINVTIKTAVESMLFSWMLFHRDAIRFKVDNKIFELVDHSYEKATVKVSGSGIEEGTTTVTINDPYDWKFNDHASGDGLDYKHAGDYCYIDHKEIVHIGTDLEGDVSFSFMVNNDWSLEEVHLGNHIYPDVEMLGLDEDNNMHYLINFKNYHSLRLLYDTTDPLESVIEMD